MIIDVIYAVLMVLALIQGYRRGLIAAIFSFVSIIVGLAAAMKLSAAVAKNIGHSVKISDKWLPVVSFIVVFIIVVVLVRLGAKAIQKVTETVMLGWVNRLGGMIFYAAIYTTVFSILLFYANEIKIIDSKTLQASVSYPFIQPWGPKVIDGLAAVIPWFKNMFAELEKFFAGMSGKISGTR